MIREEELGEELADRLSQTVIAMQRAIVRAARTSQEIPALPTAQAEIVFKLLSSGPMSPARIASELRLAGPTVSNLITAMVKDGLLHRMPSSTDGRSVIIEPTDRAREVITRFALGRVQVTAVAIRALSESDQRWIEAAQPALEALLEVLLEISKDSDLSPISD